MFPFKINQTCSRCNKTIEANEEIYAKMKYPQTRGTSEIKAYLYQNTKVICADCVVEKPRE